MFTCIYVYTCVQKNKLATAALDPNPKLICMNQTYQKGKLNPAK